MVRSERRNRIWTAENAFSAQPRYGCGDRIYRPRRTERSANTETHNNITESLRTLLSGPAEPDTEPENGAQALALVAYRAALKGNDKYFKLIRDMTEGEEPGAAEVSFYFEECEDFSK